MTDGIGRLLKERQGELHRDILELVRVPSVSTDREGARRALGLFLHRARALGLSTSLEADGDVGVADWDPGLPAEAETLGILAHVDVVDPGDQASWTKDPWGEIADDAIWGRGVQDDKGPLVICLHALRAVLDLGLPVRKRVRFVVGTMEEIDWADIRAWIPRGRIPDYGFTPDGEFPVINREKGYCDAWLSFDRARAFGRYRIEEFEAGVSINSVPGAARIVLAGPRLREFLAAGLEALSPAERGALDLLPGEEERVELRARGRAAHSSQPEQGDNALVRLCAALKAIGDPAGGRRDPCRNPLVDFVTEHLGGDHRAESLGLQTRPETALGEFVGPTTASPDTLRAEGESLLLGINLRTGYGQTREELESAFAAHARRSGFRFRLEQYMPAIFVPRDRPFMRALLAAYERRTGMKGDFALAPGSSYAKALPKVAAFGPILPGMIDLCHQVDERMSFTEIETCAAIYADAIAAIVGDGDACA